ncbi:MAG: T9SS type A sorting domain-containing protein [Cytophagales bacterium]|nr:T9SS type A sorting domain-containing protein [Cytophaga sp.]
MISIHTYCKIVFLFVISFLMNTISSNAQISGIINHYSKVTAIEPSCSKVTVTDPSYFAAGDLVLIMQMKGVLMNETNTAAFGDVQSVNGSGNYEYHRIQSIDGNDLYFYNTILRTYEINGSVQLIYTPEYTDVTIAGTLTAKAWDGTTGGILALSASGSITCNADINVEGLGFMGGNPSILASNCPVIFLDAGNVNYYFPSNSKYAFKGEGIADFIANKTNGRGKQVSGGGGGNQHNTGGGGGSNYGNGGLGGDQSSSCTLYKTNASGGLALGASYIVPFNKVFLGGGGGGGDQDNNVGGKGGTGGGMVFITANQIIATNTTINANGQDGSNSPGDGAGGGGSGGAVILDCPVYSGALTITVDGGTGGTTTSNVAAALGPGGGGSGGIIWFSNASVPLGITTFQNGGNAGVSYNNNTTLQGNRHATNGDAGNVLLNASVPISTALNPCTLPVTLIRFDTERKSDHILLSWTTANEENNAGFIIEKSMDGINYDSIGILTSLSNAARIQSYTYRDYSYQANTTIYYKLSQRDIDGTMHLLGIKTVHSVDDAFNLRVFPNPSNGTLTIESSGPVLIDYTVYTVTGNRIAHEQPVSKSITLYDLNPGYYIIVITFEDRVEKRTFIVQ